MKEPKRIVVWFSCGAASTVCADLALKKYKDKVEVIIAYTDPGTVDLANGKIGEHEDNKRFIKECEKWLNHPITILKSKKFENPNDVFEKRRYIKGVAGAPCTTELKKRLREQFQEPGDLQVFGFTAEEQKRAERFRQANPEVSLWTPLIEWTLTKASCLAYLKDAGLELPMMYRLGYRNNNCIGCVKGGMGYWNKIRKDFPEIFDATAKLEREIGASILRKQKTENGKKVSYSVYLDELEPDVGNYKAEPDIECSILCIMPDDAQAT